METILYCPLDWGLGHATRIIPLIQKNLAEGHRVVLAGYGRSGELLKNEFSMLEFIDFPGFRVQYQFRNWLLMNLVLQLPLFVWHLYREHYLLEKIIEKIKPTRIISDNRYGAWSSQIESVLITHQLNPQLPVYLKFGQPCVQWLTKQFIARFHRCWIPDWPAPNSLSGNLSRMRHIPSNVEFIGPLSRFVNKTGVKGRGNFVLVILSGPEPERTRFQNICISKLKELNVPAIIVLGVTEKRNEYHRDGNILKVNYLSMSRLNYLVSSCRLVICRSGYSSIMDLVATATPALLIPTSGQTEQLYLAKHLQNHRLFRCVSQRSFQKLNRI
jgi:uncharacterized protein (TIGR00661 family)